MFNPEKNELIVITGKGGVGRTVVAAALGRAVARPGNTTVVCEVAEQGVIPRLLGGDRVESNGETDLGDGLAAATIDPDATLREWIRSQFGAPIARTLGASRSFSQLVAAAPGAAELLTITKAWEMGPGRGFGKGTKDHATVILDAPASGHGVAMLRSPRTFADIAAGGPIRKQAEKVWDLLRDPSRCAIVAVTLPSELPVTETIELDTWMQEMLGRGLDLVVANRCEPSDFTATDIQRIRKVVRAGTLKADALDVAVTATDRRLDQEDLLAQLTKLPEVPVVRLPELQADIAPAQMNSELAQILREHVL